MTKKKKKKTNVTPAEVGRIIAENLLTKPNKRVVFGTFLNNLPVKIFVENILKFENEMHYADMVDVITILNAKMVERKEAAILQAENELNLAKQKLEDLKKMS